LLTCNGEWIASDGLWQTAHTGLLAQPKFQLTLHPDTYKSLSSELLSCKLIKRITVT